MTKSIPARHLVLYADDDEDDLQLVREAFDNYASNVEVLTFPDGISLVKFLEKREPLTPSPCLIILDINMPVLNGKEAVKEIRQIEPYQEIPIVLFSTSSLPYDKKFAEKNNAGFLTKPLNTEQLARIAEQFLDYCAEDIRRNIQKKIL
jgi:CheY-like chemotaxis protein